MDTVSSMVAFVRVATSGSFTAAANEMQVSVPQVSRSVRHLEQKLQARLLNRTTRRLALTDVGKHYLVHALQIIAHIEEAEAEAAASHNNVDGVLKIVVSDELGQGHLVRAVSEFCGLYPSVRIELITSAHAVAPSSVGCDAAVIVCSELPDLDAYYQKLGVIKRFVCASPIYLETNGIPKSPEDLIGHRWVRMRGMMKNDRLQLCQAGERSTVVVNEFFLEACSVDSLSEAIARGMGLGVLPEHAAIPRVRDGDMVQVLPAFDVPSQNIYSIYPARQYLPTKTLAWLRFIKNYNFGANPV